tara:strand:+ start:589 stop:789 length:201 start_codon:yes stop_codon:yes gene_type:complete
VSDEKNLQNALLEASDENNRQLKRIADSLEELLSMIKGVQPKELAKMAQEHKTAEANKKRQAKRND